MNDKKTAGNKLDAVFEGVLGEGVLIKRGIGSPDKRSLGKFWIVSVLVHQVSGAEKNKQQKFSELEILITLREMKKFRPVAMQQE